MLTGFDNNGRAVLAGDRVLREVDPNYREAALRIYDAYMRDALADAGVVETWLASDDRHLFEHRFHSLSFPHEWPAALLKRAALFHLRLCSDLARTGLTLKDALPNNIVFEGVQPRFVDFLSIVETGRLSEEAWLSEWSRDETDLRRTVLVEMFMPFFVVPLAAHAFGEPALARAMLRHQACRMPGEKPDETQLYGALPWRRRLRARRFIRTCRNAIASPLPRAWQALARAIDGLTIVDDTDYATYYARKGEDFDLADRTGWRAKQHAIADVLAADRPATVLDLGANTGWFSRLAASQGARVYSLDVDEASLNALVRTASDESLSILPLRIPFGELELALGASSATGGQPYFSAPVDRLTADTTLMLGLIHHLALGENRSLECILGTLARTCRQSAVIEFVGLDDPLVAGNPGFFPAIGEWSSDSYCLERVMAIAHTWFASIDIAPSHPPTRKILHLRK